MDNQTTNSSIVKTSDVIGKGVIDLSGESLGKIDEIVLEKVSGQVRYAVLASGGFMGIGSDLHAVPWESLEYSTEEDAFQLKYEKLNLEDAPGFNEDQWPDFAQSEYSKNVDNYYSPSLSDSNVANFNSDLPQTSITPGSTSAII